MPATNMDYSGYTGMSPSDIWRLAKFYGNVGMGLSTGPAVNPTQPIVNLPRAQATGAMGVPAGIYNTAAGIAEGMTSPLGMATTGAFIGAPLLRPAIGGIMGGLQAKQAGQTLGTGSVTGSPQTLTEGTLQAAMAPTMAFAGQYQLPTDTLGQMVQKPRAEHVQSVAEMFGTSEETAAKMIDHFKNPKPAEEMSREDLIELIKGFSGMSDEQLARRVKTEQQVPRGEGETAFKAGKKLEDNPYEGGSIQSDSWIEGYGKARMMSGAREGLKRFLREKKDEGIPPEDLPPDDLLE